MMQRFWCRFALYGCIHGAFRSSKTYSIKTQIIDNFSTTTKAGLKQTVLGAKFLIYDPFKN
jgi:hypothetical protein